VNPALVKQKHEIPSDSPFILFIGRLTIQKGPDILIKAIPRVLDNREDVRFVIAGEGGMKKNLKALVKKVNIQEAVKFLGYIPMEDYLELLNSCDIVCIPSRNEPFGLVLLEAWSAKRAVVASNVGGLSENIENNYNGLKVSPTPNSVAEAINYLVNNPKKQKKLGEAGRDTVKKGFSWEAIATATIESYKNVINP